MPGSVRYPSLSLIIVLVLVALYGVSHAGVCFSQNRHVRPMKPATINSPAARKAGSKSASNKTGKPQYTVSKTGGIVYRTGDGFELKCDLYVPKLEDSGNSPEPTSYPAIIAIHGGAWRSGSKITMLRHANRFAKAGYVVMAINYRHAPEHLFPAQIHDCKFAVRWLKANAEKWHVNTERVGVFGYSAGGHLAALLGTTDEQDKLEGDIPPELADFDSSVVCVSAGGAPCEFTWIDKESTVLKSWIGGTREESPDGYEKASPLNYADSSDVPFYFFHGQYDLVVPIDSSLKLHRSLGKAGVKSTHEVALLSGHISTFSNMIWAEKSLRFFDQNLKQRSSPTESVSGNANKP